jgi:hypothetical protein
MPPLISLPFFITLRRFSSFADIFSPCHAIDYFSLFFHYFSIAWFSLFSFFLFAFFSSSSFSFFHYFAFHASAAFRCRCRFRLYFSSSFSSW